LVPFFGGGDDGVGIGLPDERLGGAVVRLDEGVDGGLQGDSEWKTPRLSRRWVSLAKKVSTAFSHEHEVGVKWKIQRGWRASQCRTLACLWAP